jgi:hypothetical protein
MAGDDFKRREACKMASWIKPKMSHKQMANRLLQLRCHLILCFRAEPKIDMVKEDGKWVIVPKQTLTGLEGWVPITEKNLPFELTASLMLLADHPGVPHPIKLQAQHRPFFPLNRPITAEAGVQLAAWAAGGVSPARTEAPMGVPPPATPTSTPTPPHTTSAHRAVDEWGAKLLAATTREQLLAVNREISALKLPVAAVKQLRAAYTQRAKELEAQSAPQQPALTASDIPFGK